MYVIEIVKVGIAGSASQYSVPELLLSAPQMTKTISRKEIVECPLVKTAADSHYIANSDDYCVANS